MPRLPAFRCVPLPKTNYVGQRAGQQIPAGRTERRAEPVYGKDDWPSRASQGPRGVLSLASNGGPAAVDVDVLTGNVGAGVRGQKEQRATEFEGSAYAVEDRVALEFGNEG